MALAEVVDDGQQVVVLVSFQTKAKWRYEALGIPVRELPSVESGTTGSRCELLCTRTATEASLWRMLLKHETPARRRSSS